MEFANLYFESRFMGHFGVILGKNRDSDGIEGKLGCVIGKKCQSNNKAWRKERGKRKGIEYTILLDDDCVNGVS